MVETGPGFGPLILLVLPGDNTGYGVTNKHNERKEKTKQTNKTHTINSSSPKNSFTEFFGLPFSEDVAVFHDLNFFKPQNLLAVFF